MKDNHLSGKMKKKSIKDVELKGKTVFIRVDFDVPLNSNQEITDDTRIRASIPTLRYLVENDAKIVCASHLGDPGGEPKPKLSLKPVAHRLSKLLNQEVKFHHATIGPEVENSKRRLIEKEILLIQNLRFNYGEKENDIEFAKQLAKNIDIYVNDAFSAAHLNHASIQKITEFIPLSVAGLLLEKEVGFLSKHTWATPEKTIVLLGGDNLLQKVPFFDILLDNAHKILIGGAIAYSFLKVLGVKVGHSKVEENCLQFCQEFLQKAKKKGVQIFLPIDFTAAISIEPEVTVRMVKEGEDIPEEMMGLDIGFDSIKLFSEQLEDSEFILWTGPMGVFDIDLFSAGSLELAKEIAACSGTSIVAGGDTVRAVSKAGVSTKISHLCHSSTALLLFLSGKNLPGIQSLTEEK
jgi:3-phosphoglycerate kinase